LPKLTLNDEFNVFVLGGWGLHAHWLEDLEILVWDQILQLAEHLTKLNVGATIPTKASVHAICSCVVCFGIDVVAGAHVITRHHGARRDATYTPIHRIEQLTRVIPKLWIRIHRKTSAPDADRCTKACEPLRPILDHLPHQIWLPN
jgi:hypothetical protein